MRGLVAEWKKCSDAFSYYPPQQTFPETTRPQQTALDPSIPIYGHSVPFILDMTFGGNSLGVLVKLLQHGLEWLYLLCSANGGMQLN